MKIKIENVLETLESFPKQLDRPKTIEQLSDSSFQDFLNKVVENNNLEKKKALE